VNHNLARFPPKKVVSSAIVAVLVLAVVGALWLHLHPRSYRGRMGSVVTGSGKVVGIEDSRGTDAGLVLHVRQRNYTTVMVVIPSSFFPCDRAAITSISEGGLTPGGRDLEHIGAAVHFRGIVVDDQSVEVCHPGTYVR
jgi:hypothetical protein